MYAARRAQKNVHSNRESVPRAFLHGLLHGLLLCTDFFHIRRKARGEERVRAQQKSSLGQDA